MNRYVMLVIGAVILAGGIYLRDKKVGNIVQERLLALGTYAGWVLFTIPLSKLATPIFANAGGSWPKTGMLVLQTVLFLVGAELFLKNAFDTKAGDKYKKTDYSKNKAKSGKKGGNGSAKADNKSGEQPKKKGGFKKLN